MTPEERDFRDRAALAALRGMIVDRGWPMNDSLFRRAIAESWKFAFYMVLARRGQDAIAEDERLRSYEAGDD